MLKRWKEALKKPPRWLKIGITLLLLYHMVAITINVLSGGARSHALQRIDYSLKIRPYLDFLWLTNAYRFFSPDPGASNVVWFRIAFKDKTAQCVQLPEKRDFNWRMPLQRQVSLAMLLLMNTENVMREDEATAARMMSDNRPSFKRQFSPYGEAILQSFIRHVSRDARYSKSASGAEIESIDVFSCDYGIREPGHVRMNWDMYDPRLLTAYFVGRFLPDGKWKEPNPAGFIPRAFDDLFVDFFQNDLLPMSENKGSKTYKQLIEEYRLFDPLARPLLSLTEAELQALFALPAGQKTLDRETLRKRYDALVIRDDMVDPTAPVPVPTPTPGTGNNPVNQSKPPPLPK